MIKTLNYPYANTAKTAEIMSRYRPIAPRPESGPASPSSGGDAASAVSSAATSSSSSATSQKIRQSPYLRNLWPQLQARPTRTRKRGGRPTTAALSPPPPYKRHCRTMIPPSSSSSPPPPPCHVAFMGFSTTSHHHHHHHSQKPVVTLPLMPCPNSSDLDWLRIRTSSSSSSDQTNLIDLNTTTTTAAAAEVPEERDLLQQLQQRPTAVIAPQPVRPVGSTILVRRITEDAARIQSPPAKSKAAREVEEEVEAEALPAVISDSYNKVRMANSAYKELVGQPECLWLDSIVAAKRISGEVNLRLPHPDNSFESPVSDSAGFSCLVRIEWDGNDNNSKNSVDASCDVVRLDCESKDYVFTWRFHIRDRSSSEASQSSCNNHV